MTGGDVYTIYSIGQVHIIITLSFIFLLLLTLGVHVQRGLLYLVRVCVCVCLSAPFRPLRVKVGFENNTKASSRQDKEKKTGDFLKNAPFKSYSLCRRSAVL